MKKILFAQVTAVAIALAFLAQPVFAQDTTPTAQSHEEHHPEGKPATEKQDSGMMGSMNMDDMKGMMHECMEMHKDKKMCNQQCMDKCQEKMGKAECQKMMKQMKAKKKK